MRIFAIIILNLLGAFFAFGLLISIFDQHAGASTNTPTPLGERLTAIGIFGTITAIIYWGVWALARQIRLENSGHRSGFPVEPSRRKDE